MTAIFSISPLEIFRPQRFETLRSGQFRYDTVLLYHQLGTMGGISKKIVVKANGNRLAGLLQRRT